MLPNLTIHLLGPNDSSTFDNVADGVFDNPVNPRRAYEFLNDSRHNMIVALLDGQVVGMTSAVHYVHPDKSPELWINEVSVAPAYRRRGIAK